MATSLVILADTHLPKRAKALPPEVEAAVSNADIVIHAGDWTETPLLDHLLERSSRLVGCYGNNDGPELRKRLPLVAEARIEGLLFRVVHETGAKTGREQRMDQQFPGTDVLIFGHSHIPWDSTTPAGMRLLNPGSPTDRRRQPHCSYLSAVVADGRIDATLHRLPLRRPGVG